VGTVLSRQETEGVAKYYSTFKYIEDNRSSRTSSGRVEKRGKQSANQRMLNERDDQLDTEENVSGQRIGLARCS
jgi:hypothetical protein